MGGSAVIDVSKDAHGNWEAAHCVVQKTVRDRYWLHLEPACHVNVRLVHCHDAGEKLVNTRLLYQSIVCLSATTICVDVTNVGSCLWCNKWILSFVDEINSVLIECGT